nr:hypothetical protein [Cryobacterium sp. TMS1-20-1]
MSVLTNSLVTTDKYGYAFDTFVEQGGDQSAGNVLFGFARTGCGSDRTGDARCVEAEFAKQ